MFKYLQKIILLICISWFSFSAIQVNAIMVPVTEKIPGIDCQRREKNDNGKYQVCPLGGDAWCRIVCDIWMGFTAVSLIFQGIIKYATFIAALGAVLFIVINGIMYSMSGLDEGMKGKAKGNIMNMLWGIIVLLLSWVILSVIAPWVYK